MPTRISLVIPFEAFIGYIWHVAFEQKPPDKPEKKSLEHT
jgi:hypothetical protein